MERSPLVLFAAIVKQSWQIIGLTAAGAGAYFAMGAAVHENTRDLDHLRAELRSFVDGDARRHDFGPDGFRDPKIRAAFEASLRTYLENNGYHSRGYWDSFFQLNPTLVKPHR